MPKSEQPKGLKAKRNALLLSSPWARGVFGGLALLILCLWLLNGYYALTGEFPLQQMFISPPETQSQSIWERLGILGTSQAVGGYSERGPTGDTFGIVNSLFAGLAFLGLFYAILLQREELSTVKEERDDTRQILNTQETNIGAQIKQLNKQAFEASFYNTLELLLKHREQLINPKRQSSVGKVALNQMAREFRNSCTSPEHVHQLLQDYWTTYDSTRNESIGYIRFVMMICEMIEDSNIGGKELYREIFRSQLSESDLILIFFAAFSEKGKTSAWRTLAIKSNLLKYISLSDWPDECQEAIQKIYPPETIYLKCVTTSAPTDA
ncbi:putative phage abortive infection protein [Pseudovibrio sp. Ad26]|uniref:putative phage abortive infection protein n=1 Tax=Pseudovibrio sp. Ad26 TaxID=989410 RepID=UPI0007AEE4B2|nr:putative phage abortive infection protein [Pseudovibrio sp. Ad26]KZL10701.1 hypothetical protein PsAD26_03066 [Pseudovibrio sp. Ad26]